MAVTAAMSVLLGEEYQPPEIQLPYVPRHSKGPKSKFSLYKGRHRKDNGSNDLWQDMEGYTEPAGRALASSVQA